MFERDFTDFLRYLTIERGLSRNTADAYRRDLEDYAAWLTARSIDSFREVKRETIVNYLNFGHSERAMEPATLARRLVAIKMLYRHLEEEGLIKENPAAVLESPKLWRVLPDFLTVSEVNAFLNAWPEKGTALELRNRTMLELLYASGLRVSELTNLPLAAPDFDNHLVRVTGKGEKPAWCRSGKPRSNSCSAISPRHARYWPRKIRPPRSYFSPATAGSSTASASGP